MLKKYGKSSEGLLAIKQSFFIDNDSHLQRQDRISAAYLRQPERTRCKSCTNPVTGVDFVSHNVPYKLCDVCHHLNGMHEETDEFFHEVYHRDAGQSYGATYIEQASADSYALRVQKIYRPKAAFLRECLESAGVATAEGIAVSDFGAGAGYFVAALREEGFDARGFEVSAAQVALGNRMLGADVLRVFDPAQTASMLARDSCRVLSLIGVLEHVPSPRDALTALKANPNVEYVYLSVPLFSPAVCFEIVFPNSFNRHLGGAHTHLYTVRSIEHFCREFGFRVVAQWLFGTDIMDLYRHCLTTVRRQGVSDAAAGAFDSMLRPIIDPMQLCIDESGGSSEGHFLLGKR